MNHDIEHTDDTSPGAGHNRASLSDLPAIVERIERLESDKDDIAEDIKEIYTEAKSNGFDPKVLRKVIRMRKQDVADREDEEAMIDIYMHALGQLSGTPLGGAAIVRAFGEGV